MVCRSSANQIRDKKRGSYFEASPSRHETYYITLTILHSKVYHIGSKHLFTERIIHKFVNLMDEPSSVH